MSGKPILLVLAVCEPGLRSMLAARLSLVDADLITADKLDDPTLERSIRGSAALIIDEAQAARNPQGWVETLLDDPRWHHIIVLAAQPPPRPGAVHPRLLVLDRATAVPAIVELIPHWRAEN